MSHRRVRHLLSGALAAAVLCAMTWLPIAHAAEISFTITGSTQMYTLGALLANRYTSQNNGVQIAVNPTSSQAAFDDTCSDAGSQVGMSDVYIQDDQLRTAVCSDMINIPVAISATPAVYNLPGTYFNDRYSSDRFTLKHPVKLTAKVIADMYLCKVKMWNDPEIAQLNRGVPLPAQRIRLFNSSEPGGSGFIFSQWLALSDKEWMDTVGIGLQPQWPPCSTGQASSGNMAQAIRTTPYSFGFAGFDYAISYKLQAAALRNASGFFVFPSLNGLSAAINRALIDGFPVDFRKPFVTVKDDPASAAKGQHAFNPACFEFFLVHRNLKQHYLGGATGKAITGFLNWSISSAPNGGQAYIESIEFRKVGKATQKELAHGFIPVPEALRAAIQNQVNSITT